MKEAREAGVPVVAIANPGSGPGTEGDRSSYEKGMKALHDCGVEVCMCACAWACGFGCGLVAVFVVSGHDVHKTYTHL